jgi:hypothetical protein
LKYPNNIALCHELLKAQEQQIAVQGKETVRQGKQIAKQDQEILHLHKLLLEISEEMSKLKTSGRRSAWVKTPQIPTNHLPLTIFSVRP